MYAVSFSGLCRILYQVVAGQQVFCHPQYKDRHYILDKLIAFHEEHSSAGAAILRDLEAATRQLPSSAQAAEAAPLRKRLQALPSGRARGAQGLAGILPKVLARLGTASVESKPSGAAGPR